jgi:hypothetical protein
MSLLFSRTRFLSVIFFWIYRELAGNSFGLIVMPINVHSVSTRSGLSEVFAGNTLRYSSTRLLRCVSLRFEGARSYFTTRLEQALPRLRFRRRWETVHHPG